MPFSLFKSKKLPSPPADVKAESERIIKSLGGRGCSWLPLRERTDPRPSAEVADRALALHAMIEIAFRAPTGVIADWIEANQLQTSLTAHEQGILARKNDQLSQEEINNLTWGIEALWALTWAGGLIPELRLDLPVGDNLALLLPDLHKNEPATNFRRRFALRPPDALYAMLDLYYRAHWYARDGQLNDYPTGPFNLDIIMERRRALEWINDRSLASWYDTREDT